MALRLLMTLALLMEPSSCVLTWSRTSLLLAPSRTVQRCWAHLLREARYLAEHVEEARPFSEALHRLYGGLRRWAVDKPPPEMGEGLAGEARKVMMDLVGRPYESEEARRFAGKVLNGMDHWFTFLTVPGVEPTNNRAERALRESVVQRKIMGCFRNGKGTRIYETVMTVLASWKQQGRDLPQALGETLTQEWTEAKYVHRMILLFRKGCGVRWS
jgi:hypothetical protein